MADKPAASSVTSTIVSGAAYSLAALIIVRVLSIARSIAVARILGAGQLGFLTIVNQIVDTVSVFAGFGLPAAAAKFVAESTGDSLNWSRQGCHSYPKTADTIRTCYLALLPPLMIAGILLFGFAPRLALGLYRDPQFTALFRIAAVILVFQSLYALGLGSLQGLKEIRRRSAADIVATAIGVPLTIALTAWAKVEGAVWGQLALTLVGALVVTTLLFRFDALGAQLKTAQFDRAFLPRLVRFAFPAFLAGLFMNPAILITTTRLFNHAGSRSAGLFNIALTAFGVVLFIPMAAGVPLVPVIAQHGATDALKLRRLTATSLAIVAFVTFIIACALIVFPRELVTLLYGADFAQGAPVLAIMAGAVFLAGIGMIAGYYVMGRGRMWHGLLFNVLWFGLIVVSAFILIPLKAEQGLALAWLIAYFGQAVLVMCYFAFVVRISVRFPLLLAALILPLLYFQYQSGGDVHLPILLRFALLLFCGLMGFVFLPVKTELGTSIIKVFHRLTGANDRADNG